MMNQGTILILVGLILLFIIFLLCRELVCWYFKINIKINMMDEQNQMLSNIMDHFKIKRVG